MKIKVRKPEPYLILSADIFSLSKERFSLQIDFEITKCLAHESFFCRNRPFDFKRVGFFSSVCIDIEGAPEVCSVLVGRVKIDADIRRLALGKQFLLECCGKAVAGGGDGVYHELLVASILIDKVEGVTRIIPIQREVADGVVEDDAWRCRAFP